MRIGQVHITFLVFCILFLNTTIGLAQTVISGKMTNKSDPSLQRGINITVQTSRNSGILAFAISKEDGGFEISFESDLDSLWLIAKSMTIEKIELRVANFSQLLQLQAKQADFVLEEYMVEGVKSPITSKKDTLSYDVERFTNQEDRVLVDVLKRLPGLEVSPNGAISYRGESIQKFYIEGLDLLEGRYNIATRNMPVDAVKSVEILENHQPIRMLDSIEITSRSSINIKLKKQDVVIGRGYIGGGFPGIWDVKVAPMIFNKTFQSIISFGTNNAGINLSDEILDLGSNLSDSKEKMSRKWFRSAGIRQGSMLDNRFIFNKSLLGSVNTIKKLPNDLELKSSLDYSRENINNSFLKNKSYFTEGGTVEIVEAGQLTELSDHVRLNLNLTKNSRSEYFHNRFQFSLVNSSFSSDFTFVDQIIDQKIRQPDLYLSNNFRKLIKVGFKVLDFNSELSLLTQRPRLSTNPPFLGTNSDAISEDSKGSQHIRYSSYSFNNHVSYKNFKVFNFSTAGTSGILFKSSNLLSSGFLDELQIGFPFENNIRLSEMSGYSSISLERNTKKSNLKLTLPIRFVNFQLTDIFDEASIGSPNQFLFEPELYWGFDLGPYFNFRNNFSRKVDVGDLYDIYPGQIFINYETVQVKSSHIPIVQDNRLVLRQSFKDPLISLFINSTFSLGYSNRNTLMENQVDENGRMLISAINKENVGRTLYWNGDASKFVTGIRTTLAVGSIYNWTEREIAVNEVFQFVNFNRLNVYLKAAYRPLGKVNFELKYDYTSVQSVSGNAFDNQSFISTPSFIFLFLPSKEHIAKLTFESMSVNSNKSTSKSQINFLDFEYNYKVSKKRLEFSLICNNLLGQSQLATISNSSFVFIEELRRLRPRQVTFRLGYSL